MKLKVVGGTHLGIVGCYGITYVEVVNFEDVIDAVKKKVYVSLDGTKLNIRKNGSLDIFSWENERNETVFEFHLADRELNKKLSMYINRGIIRSDVSRSVFLGRL